MAEIIGIIILIYLIYLLIVKVIIPYVLPFFGYVALAAGGIGVLWAFFSSITNYIKSFKENGDAYQGYVDNSPKKPDPNARRSYFFGPGYHQIAAIVRGAWANQRETFDKTKEWVDRSRSWFLNIFVWIFFICFCIACGVVGSIFTAIFSALHFIFVFAFMCVFYVFFSVLWLCDRIVLVVNSIASRCPSCKKQSVIPVFVCPNCGKEHNHLVPGPYGIFVRRCSCRKRLPTTFITGRSRLPALCPSCKYPLPSSNANQFGIQLIGGSAAGKTVFLTSFFHLYREKLKSIAPRVDLNGDFKNVEGAFQYLEEMYNRGQSEATNEMNAKMYSIVHTRKGRRVSHEFAIYDVAGEIFAGQSADREQKQYRYCEGIILIVDPLSEPSVRREYSSAHGGQEPANYSTTDVGGVVAEFNNELMRIGNIKSNRRSGIPVSVVIAKSDVDVVYQKISPARIEEVFSQNSYKSKEEARDAVCRDYLYAIGMSNMINIIDAQYTNVHYFPVSALGHETGKAPYKPWGVLEAVLWIIKERDFVLTGMLGKMLNNYGGRTTTAQFFAKLWRKTRWLVAALLICTLLSGVGLGFYTAGSAAYRAAISIYAQIPKTAYDFNERGKANAEKGNYEKAIVDYTKAIKYDSHYAEAYYNRGLVYYDQKDYEKAIEDWEKAAHLKPEDNDAKKKLEDFMRVTSDTKKLLYIPKEKRYETLGLRESAKSGSKTIARVERGDLLLIKETGAQAVIAGMRSNWVYVEALTGKSKGSKGWCFKGYLDKLE